MEPRLYGRLYRLPIRFEREPDVQLLAVSLQSRTMDVAWLQSVGQPGA